MTIPSMPSLKRIFSAGFFAVVVLFGIGAFGLIVLAAIQLWTAFDPTSTIGLTDRFNVILKCIAMLTIAMASLDLAETVVEEELQRAPKSSTPVRVRRVLSRFLVVVVVSLSVESLVAVFQYAHDEPEQLVNAAAIAVAAAALLIGWGAFIRLTRTNGSEGE